MPLVNKANKYLKYLWAEKLIDQFPIQFENTLSQLNVFVKDNESTR